MKLSVKVRPVQAKDRASLALVFQAAFSNEPFHERWGRAQVLKRVQELLSDKSVAGWVVMVFGQPIGFSFLQVRQGARELYGELLETAVHPYFQGQGIERTLLSAVKRFQKAKKVRNVMVLAFKGPHAEWFRGAGWVESKRTTVLVSR